MKLHLMALMLGSTVVLGGCATTTQHALDLGGESQLQRRSYQSRMFETADRERVLRATISTLQDLGFIIDRADSTLGTVSATKLDGYQAKVTVSVRPRGEDRILVRANAQVGVRPIEDPEHYQDFFTSLEKSLFLTAHAGE